MAKPKIEDVLTKLDGDIVNMTKTFFTLRRKNVEKAMVELKENMKKDIVRWSHLLDEGKLSASEFESLVQSQIPTLKIALLEQVAVSKKKVDGLTAGLATLVVKAGLEALDSAV